MYLACLLYHEGKVLVTNDDTLPVIEIDENYPSNYCSEYPWLLKVETIQLFQEHRLTIRILITSQICCNWDVVKALRNEMEKYSSSVNQFRLNLLSALSQMQSAMGIKDLGFFYYKFLQDANGTAVLTCINSIKVNLLYCCVELKQRKLLFASFEEILRALVFNEPSAELKA